MFSILLAAGIFGGVVWMIAYAIFLLLRAEKSDVTVQEAHDSFRRFVEENYGSRFLPEQSLRRCS